MQGDGLELARRGDLQEFQVIGTVQLVMNDARRLHPGQPLEVRFADAPAKKPG